MSGTVLATFSVLKNHVKLKVTPDAAFIDNIVFRLHYRATFMVLLIGSILVTSRQFFGEHIKCMLDTDTQLISVVNTFCFFSSTFTITKYMNTTALSSGRIPHPGVGPYTGREEIVRHAYYQWVPFVLFFQALIFYMPHYIWRCAEGGSLKKLVEGLHVACFSNQNETIEIGEGDSKQQILPREEVEEKIQRLRTYFLMNLQVNRTWGYYLGVCEVLNFGNAIAQFYITDWFLGGTFLKLGIKVMEFQDWSSRVTPLDVVFPKVTKCSFHKYGPSGTIENHEAVCIMALNIVNEKIYIVLWFWLIALITASTLAIIWRILTVILYSRSSIFNRFAFSLACPGQHNPWIATTLIRNYHFGHWLFLYYIAKNVDSYAFNELLRQLVQDGNHRESEHNHVPGGNHKFEFPGNGDQQVLGGMNPLIFSKGLDMPDYACV